MKKIKDKICGIVLFAIGFGILYLEYIVICAIGALGEWIADIVGATGGAHTGITLLAYVPMIGLILLGLIVAGLIFASGIEMFKN